MGGNALLKYDSRRVSKENFDKESKKALSFLDYVSGKTGLSFRAQCVKSYRNKPDFGDIDIIVEGSLFSGVSKDALLSYAADFYKSAVPGVKNGDVISFGAPLDSGGCIQIDLIIATEQSYDFSAAYFAWNDLGNLMGRIAHKMGLKFGHNGLWLPIRSGSNLIESVLVTGNFKAALILLGYDPERWYEGFDSLDDIFKFVASSEKFNKDIFLLENRNNKSRTRDRKRPNYTGFLEWSSQAKSLPEFSWNKDKSVYLDEIFDSFPLAKEDFNSAIKSFELKQAFKKSFNGQVATGVTGLTGEALGIFMSQYRHENIDFLNSAEKNPEESTPLKIRQSIEVFFENWKGRSAIIPS